MHFPDAAIAYEPTARFVGCWNDGDVWVVLRPAASLPKYRGRLIWRYGPRAMQTFIVDRPYAAFNNRYVVPNGPIPDIKLEDLTLFARTFAPEINDVP